MRKMSFIAGLVALLLATGPLAAAELPPVPDLLGVRALGAVDAPVTVTEFSSLTCPHCAHFHIETLPRIKAEYVDTGKVRLVYSEFPLGALALAAAMVGRCVDESQFFPFTQMLFENQAKWSAAADPLATLGTYARLAGMPPERFDACLNSAPLMNGLRAGADAASKQWGIDSTPSFVVNGRLVPGALPFDEFKPILDQALAAAGR